MKYRDSNEILNSVLTVLIELKGLSLPIRIELLSLNFAQVVVFARFKFSKRSKGAVKLTLSSTVGGDRSHVGAREAQAKSEDGATGEVST